MHVLGVCVAALLASYAQGRAYPGVELAAEEGGSGVVVRWCPCLGLAVQCVVASSCARELVRLRAEL